jgi:hypothetical protein
LAGTEPIEMLDNIVNSARVPWKVFQPYFICRGPI